MINRTAQEIMKNWKGDFSKPMVSICTITYNHEKYIAEAIDSFLMQETDFPFEIVIGEDCSTDVTRKIIQEYINKYPNIITLIISDSNVGMQENGLRTMNACKGEFIAFCEGDDYWTDAKKLQIQIDEMKKYPKCNISFHYGIQQDELQNNELFCKHADENKFFSIYDVIKFGGPLMPTASICLRNNFIKSLLNNENSFYKNNLTGFFIQLFATTDYDALYINRNMCTYQKMTTSSWTKKFEEDYEFRIYWLKRSIDSMDNFNQLTNYKFKKSIDISKKGKYLLLFNSDIIPLNKRKEFYKKYKEHLNITDILKYKIRNKYPSLYNILVNLNNIRKKSIEIIKDNNVNK